MGSSSWVSRSSSRRPPGPCSGRPICPRVPGPAGVERGPVQGAVVRPGLSRPCLLKQQFGLSTAEVPKPDEAIDALAWKLIGFEGEDTEVRRQERQDGAVQPRAGRRPRDRLQEGRQPAGGTARRVRGATIPRSCATRSSATGSTGARAARARRRISSRSLMNRRLTSAASPELDLPAFAERVKAAARDCPTGRFGDNKVFIAHVWKASSRIPRFATMDLDAFKERLAEANNARLLDLSRADLVQAMDPDDVRQSEVHYLNATFHFVRI